MNLHIICNPTSGNYTGRTTLQKVLELLEIVGIHPVVHETKRQFQAIEFAKQAVLEKADTVIAIGGDGTLHEVALGLVNTGTALGIIPAGTGNDFVKTILSPTDIQKALDLILNTAPKSVDTVWINDLLFINECGCGFDVMVLDFAEKAKKHVKGILPYLYGVLKTIFHFKDIALTYSINDGPLQNKNILVLAAGNGRFIGGGIPIAPNAIVDDGLLDVLIVNGMSKLRMLSVLPGLLKGKIQTFPETSHQYAKKLHIEGTGLRINIDGEIVSMDSADIQVNPASLLVYRP
ncbi:MAG: diacylglycerol kinase family lipid kinase [Clostridia bacterium]|nr:diacylglycerol kinase family lipid kinase [Clostridia bacterium]